MAASSAKRLLIAMVIVSTVGFASSENLLFFIGFASYSHRVALQPLITKMADRGHDVTVFSPIKPETINPKIKEFCPPEFEQTNLKSEHQLSAAVAEGKHKDRNYDPLFKGNDALDLALKRTSELLHNSKFVQWIQNSTFDLIIHDAYGTQYIYPIAYRMKAKVIAFVPTACYLPSYFDLWGIPLESWTEGVVSNNFWWLPDFVYNTITPLLWYTTYTNYYLPKVEAITRNTLPFDFPPLSELVKNVDLIFTNQHFSHTYAFSTPPYVVPIGGMHIIKSNGTFSKDLEEFVEAAEEFVFISFGTIIQISRFPVEVKQTLFDAIAMFPNTRFLWKWEQDIPATLPKNVLAKSWFSQQDVLAHPKCKGFVTHGGIMSIQQAVFHKVPVVVVPGFADQPYNARIAQTLGFGIQLELADITKETFFASIQQILKNNTYAEAVNQISERFRDRPMSPVDTAVWWTEYVLRHDTTHLKSAGFRQTWWQRRSLDFWFLAFTLICISTASTFVIIITFVRKVMNVFVSRKFSGAKLKSS